MKRACEEATCPGCGAVILWARAGNDQLVPIDVERREGARIVLKHERVGEPPRIWLLDNPELETSRAEHEHKVRAGLEEPGPHRLFGFHDCRATSQH